jgi:hypothetical protein
LGNPLRTSYLKMRRHTLDDGEISTGVLEIQTTACVL